MAARTQGTKSLRSDAAELLACCSGVHSRLAARRITQFLDREVSPSGLSLAQLGLMARVATATDDRIGGLAKQMALDQSTLSRNLRALEGAGLVEIAVAERDLRRRAVWLTEAGARRLETAIPLWRDALRKLTGRLDVRLVRRLAFEASALVPAADAHPGPANRANDRTSTS